MLGRPVKLKKGWVRVSVVMEPDMLEFVDRRPSRSEYIRGLIMEDMKKEGGLHSRGKT
jgi:hypothetical protein